jgi:hypothetical protein
MISRVRIRTLTVVACVAALCACASKPPANPGIPATVAAAPTGESSTVEKKSPAGQTRHKWSKANEAEVAKTLDERFREAAKTFVKLKRDDQVMFCKRYRDIGSMIPQLHCITEAELRKQVEDSDELRDQVRRKVGRCDLTSGCGGGPDPISKYPLPQQ